MPHLRERNRKPRMLSARSLQLANRRQSSRRLAAERLERRLLLTTVTGVSPEANTHVASVSTDISATFDQDVVVGTATPENFVVHGTVSRGRLVGAATTVTAAGPVITHNPTSDFAAGELVQVTATSGISTAGGAANSRVWQFRTASGGSGQFVDSGQSLLSVAAQFVTLGDIDGDGDVDAVLGNSGAVAVNDGTAVFTDSGQRLTPGGDLELGDIDGDGDLDVVGTNEVWLNDGTGLFTDTNQSLGGGITVAVGDLDGDGDLDAMVGVAYTSNRVFLNDGNGTFSNSGQTNLGTASPQSIEFADFDGDGDLDAFAANNGPANEVWLNDGSGVFTNSGQAMGGFRPTQDVELGDFDGDGDVDALVVNQSQPNRLWLNDGDGLFTDSGQALGNHRSFGLAVGDLDGDGDLDAFVANSWALNITQEDSRVWLNDGAGTFSDSGQRFAPFFNYAVDIADLDGDGDLDVWLATNSQPSQVLINQNLTPNVTLAADSSSVAEAAGEATITATLSATHTAAVTIDLGVSGTASTDDYTLSAMQIVIPAGETSGSVTVTAVQDVIDEPDETVIVDLEAATNAQEVGTQQVTVTILDDDEPIVPDVTLAVDNTSIPEAAGVATFAVTLSAATTNVVTVDLAIGGTATASTDYTSSGTQVVFQPGATTASVTITAVQDAVDEPDETVVVEITSVTGGNELGVQQQTTTILDDDVPPSFVVTSLIPTDSGFRVEFNNPVDGGDINLYDTQNAAVGAADVVVTGTTTGAVTGSLIVGERSLTFIKSGDALAADTYTVTLRSGTGAFEDTGGQLLDGNSDGTGGDDYVGNFTVEAAPAGARTVGVADFVRGPGQEVNLPASQTVGIPITISEGDGVRAADIRIGYDPELLEITDATSPAGGTVVLNTTTTPGVAILVYFATASLPAGEGTLINLQANVPAANASEIYRAQQVLDLHDVVIGDGNDNEFPVVVDDALHSVTYFADVSGNGRINAADAAQVARFAALIDSGFAASLSTDPGVVGDISGNGRVNAADASLVAQFAALLPVPEIPAIPGGIAITGQPAGRLLDGQDTPNSIGWLFLAPSDDGFTDNARSDAARLQVISDFSFELIEPAVTDTLASDRERLQYATAVADELDDEELLQALENAISDFDLSV